MKNSKEVIILIILIFIVLVSTAKAEDESLPLLSTISITNLEYFELDKASGITTIDRSVDRESSLEIGVVSTSSLSDLHDDYGFVVTLTALF